MLNLFLKIPCIHIYDYVIGFVEVMSFEVMCKFITVLYPLKLLVATELEFRIYDAKFINSAKYA